MKRMFLAIVALLPTLVMAQNYDQIYARTPKQVTAEQLAQNEQLCESVREQYEALKDALNEARLQCTQEARASQQSATQARPKPTAQQKQAGAAVQGDIMGALAAAGISMEQMASMSEEEIEAILMPMVAKNTGLTEAEMRKLENMSDKEAEAYLKAHPDIMQRMQKSNYGQKGVVMNGMAEGLETISKADEKAVERIQEIQDFFVAETQKEVTESVHQNWYTDAQASIAGFKFDSQSYTDRINAIFGELKEKTGGKRCVQRKSSQVGPCRYASVG